MYVSYCNFYVLNSWQQNHASYLFLECLSEVYNKWILKILFAKNLQNTKKKANKVTKQMLPWFGLFCFFHRFLAFCVPFQTSFTLRHSPMLTCLQFVWRLVDDLCFFLWQQFPVYPNNDKKTYSILAPPFYCSPWRPFPFALFNAEQTVNVLPGHFERKHVFCDEKSSTQVNMYVIHKYLCMFMDKVLLARSPCQCC